MSFVKQCKAFNATIMTVLIFLIMIIIICRLQVRPFLKSQRGAQVRIDIQRLHLTRLSVQ